MKTATLKDDLSALRRVFDTDTLAAIDMGAAIRFRAGEGALIRRTLTRLEAQLAKTVRGGEATKGILKPRLAESELSASARSQRQRRARERAA